MNQESILSVSELTTEFFLKQGPVKVISDLTYDVYKGEILGVVGESGCGKSVTSLSIMRLLAWPGRVTGGSIRFDGKDLATCSEKEMESIRGNKIAMIFQEPMTALNPVYKIGDQISEQILTHNKGSKAEARDRSIEMLQLVGIPSPEQRFESYPHELSGGMRQRAMIAMALSTNPKFLIADEPTTALDVTIQAQILELIQSLQEKLGMSVQFITHDLGVISELSDRVMVMYGGMRCEVAPSKDLFSNPKHPYTHALIEARPKMGQRVTRLKTIEGSVPALNQKPPGCPFQNRCPNVSDLCKTIPPPATMVGPGHFVNCYHPMN